MAKMKAEFLNGWHKENGIPFISRFFGEPERYYPLASAIAPVSNLINRWSGFRYLLQETIGIDARRELPTFARQHFRRWFRENRESLIKPGRPRVVLLVDLFTNYNEPEIARAACRLLDGPGYNVTITEAMSTGRPQISTGLLDKARNVCDILLRELAPLVESGAPVVGLEPSEILTLRDECPDLCSETLKASAESVSGNSWLLEEFLVQHFEEHPDHPERFWSGGGSVELHGHCHTKSLVGNAPLVEVLKRCGFVVNELKAGCCGMAGSFGYATNRYEVSMEIGEKILFPAVRRASDETVICASGLSCRHQIVEGTGREALHPAEILADALL